MALRRDSEICLSRPPRRARTSEGRRLLPRGAVASLLSPAAVERRAVLQFGIGPLCYSSAPRPAGAGPPSESAFETSAGTLAAILVWIANWPGGCSKAMIRHRVAPVTALSERRR